ncbi:uncharacterized protein LOC125261562 [Megalobrama amblycephala]|uniref:uncharacterized protein LOC125261562 n=1 Tax=Megalobrama amblycephala TaxID=75352 RepID=UPI0020142FFB|nr:uncharacterized protein LOC125261562 [Megalobrama amblycephala]
MDLPASRECVAVSLSSGYNPQMNGQMERKIQEIGRYLCTFCHGHLDSWNQYLGWAEYAQNSLRQPSTGLTPFQLTDYLRRSETPTYQPGQKVWLSTRDIRLRRPCRKLSPRFIGPFTILEQINPVTYKLQLPPEYRIHPTFHSLALTEPNPPSHSYWMTELPILNSRCRSGQLEYVVDWEGYGPEERSWVPRNNILDPNLLETFHSAHPDRPPPRGRGRPTQRSSGVDDPHVFISSGENVHLPCNNDLSDSKSTTWLYYNRYSATVALIELGIKKKDTERHERLSLGSDCSLNIKNVTEEDYGSYICRQFVNGEQQGTDADVNLHVLHVSSSSSSSSSSSQTEISPGRSVTLSCQLYSGFSCDYWVRSEGLHLLWVNQAGVDLKTDSRYQILFSSDHCIITLTTTLLNEDDNREWRCQLAHRNQLQTSVRYTVKYSVIVIVVASFAVLLPALILWMIRRKRDDNRRGTDDSEDHQTRPVYPTGQITLPQQEQTDDHVTYSEVTAYSKNQDQKKKVRCDDKVTYASIRGAKAGSQENCSELYASVNKNHHKSVK